MDNDQISLILTYLLVGMFLILIIMAFIYLNIAMKERKRKKMLEKDDEKKDIKKDIKQTEFGSVLDFMEFETVEDNMIIKKEKQKYVMVIECQGVNYDLMSGVEKTGVEEGFLQFLNTLRHPVQLYIQTRSINLEKSIETYKKYLKDIENTYNRKKMQYDKLKNLPNISDNKKQEAFFELTKSLNLYEYGKDVIRDTERMSLNKNILNKKYYIVVSYFYENTDIQLKYDKDEIRNMAFSDLYTKSQSLIRTLTSCGVNGKILDSIELIELLYMAYNREGAEAYGIERALKASYDKLYSTAPDVFNKRINELDKEVETLAIQRAQEELIRIKTQKEQEAKKKEEEKEKLIADMARIIIEANKQYIGKDLAKKAIENINKEEDKKIGGNINEKEKNK